VIVTSDAAAVDRRVRRSRQAIRDAFVAVTLEQGYENVTVEAIIQRADVARATFYAHYSDKHELLAAIVEDLASELTDRLIPIAETGRVVQGAVVRELFRHADECRELYRITLSGAVSGRARAAYSAVIRAAAENVFRRSIEANGGKQRIPVEITARAWTGSFVALLEWWLAEETGRTAEEMTIITMELLIRGYVWAGGLDERGFEFDTSLLAARPPADDAR
jgi:AcrR family transcriptional regulator